jgi:hypothetical protein
MAGVSGHMIVLIFALAKILWFAMLPGFRWRCGMNAYFKTGVSSLEIFYMHRYKHAPGYWG